MRKNSQAGAGPDMTNGPGKTIPPVPDEKLLRMTDALRKAFPLFLNEESIKSAVESVCADFGKVKYLNILPAMRGSSLHCACSLRLESATAGAVLKSRFQVMEHAGELQFMVEVDDRWTGRTI